MALAEKTVRMASRSWVSFLRGAEISLVENQEFATVFLEDLLDEFGSEPGESVSVGNHKRELIALVNSFQYGSKSFAPVVES